MEGRRVFGRPALALAVAAVLAMVGSWGCAAPKRASTAAQEAAELGRQIYERGVGHDGAIERTADDGSWVRSGGSCASCHGLDAEGTDSAPPIGMSILGAEHDVPQISGEEPLQRLYRVHDPAHGDAKEDEDGEGSDATPELHGEVMTEGPWAGDDVIDVVRTGVTPEGYRLSARMPLWNIDDTDGKALVRMLDSR